MAGLFVNATVKMSKDVILMFDGHPKVRERNISSRVSAGLREMHSLGLQSGNFLGLLMVSPYNNQII